MKVLGIESSFDETAVGIVLNGDTLLSNAIVSSQELHARYGGVVPENAARSHIEAIIRVIEKSLKEANCTWDDIDAIAVTYGAGLGGSLLVGVLTARTLAITKNKPLHAINHVEGHLYANFITKTSLENYNLAAQQPIFPVLGLIVSGAHSQLVLFEEHFRYTLLGQTQDDAIGEAFDKIGRLLGLPYPGGLSVSRKAEEGNASTFQLPKARMTSVSPALHALRARTHTARADKSRWGKCSYDFSFSGLKTAVLRLAQEQIGEDFTFPSTRIADRLTEQQKCDIAASFRRTALETIVDKTLLAYKEFTPKSVIIGGGVASDITLRTMLAERLPCSIDYTDRKLCTDNGAMIAALGYYHITAGHPPADPYILDIAPNLSM